MAHPVRRCRSEQRGAAFERIGLCRCECIQSRPSILIRSRLPAGEPAAFYVEREEPSTTKTVYAQKILSRGKGLPKRRSAHGVARVIVRPPVRINQTVGSEGIVANLVSQPARAEPARFYVQPSAEILREEAVRHLVVVTDLIGSGTRL